MNNHIEKVYVMNTIDKAYLEKLSHSKKWYTHTILFGLRYLLFIGKTYASNLTRSYVVKDILELEEDTVIKQFLFNLLVDELDYPINLLEETLSDLYSALIKFPEGFNYFMKHQTNPSILNLASKLLNIQEEEVVADFCSGIGSFLISSSLNNSKALYHGFELEKENYLISKMKSKIIKMFKNKEVILDFHHNDILLDDIPIQFDKIFMELPLNVRANDVYLSKLHNTSPLFTSLTLSSSLDWAFMTRLIYHLKEDGIGVVLAHPSSTTNIMSESFRKHFIDNKHIKAVISLPSNMLNYSTIPTVLYVLGHNQQQVTFIDATNIYFEDRRLNSLTNEEVTFIESLLQKESDLSVHVSLDDIKNNDYKLSPSQYLMKQEYNHSLILGDVASIKRGFMIKAEDLDNKISSEPTQSHYLITSDINDGIIEISTPYLKNQDHSFERYLIKDRNIVISRSGTPFKVALFEDNGHKVYAQGNLIVIDITSSKINPYYLQAFLQSDVGQTALKNISTEGQFSLLSITSLKSLIIPLLPLTEQSLIAKRYQRKIEELKTLLVKKRQIIEEIKNEF